MLQSNLCDQVAAIVVTYQPDLTALKQELDALCPQVCCTIVVDNGSDNQQELQTLLSGYDACLESLTVNAGIAHAQNVGIVLAQSYAVRDVLLMDQDSIPAPDMVARLLAAKKSLQSSGHRVAAVGARFVDARYKELPCFNRVVGCRMQRMGCDDVTPLVKADYLIASGSLLSLEAVESIGGMMDEFFIDYVDTEWGLRAKSAGLACFGVCEARLAHSLGENPVRFLGRVISTHSPTRNYYVFRNAIMLYRKEYVRWNWVLADMQNLIWLFLKAAIVGPERMKRLKLIGIGLWHGVVHKSGPLVL